MTGQSGRDTSEDSHRSTKPGGDANGPRSSGERIVQANRARPLLLGHRGARPLSRIKLSRRAARIPPENTLAAFEYALAQGCDGFEFDVRITRDERLVLCHNASLKRREVAASTYDSLCSSSEQKLPCLEDVLARFGGRAYLDIEIKVHGGEELILDGLRRNKPRRYLVSSFLPQVLRRFHDLDPSLPLGFICDRPENVRGWHELPIQVFLPQYQLISEKLIRDVHSRGMKIFTWTVNRTQDIQRLAAWGIDGLISDDPELLHQTFHPSPTPANGE